MEGTAREGACAPKAGGPVTQRTITMCAPTPAMSPQPSSRPKTHPNLPLMPLPLLFVPAAALQPPAHPLHALQPHRRRLPQVSSSSAGGVAKRFWGVLPHLQQPCVVWSRVHSRRQNPNRPWGWRCLGVGGALGCLQGRDAGSRRQPAARSPPQPCQVCAELRTSSRPQQTSPPKTSYQPTWFAISHHHNTPNITRNYTTGI